MNSIWDNIDADKIRYYILDNLDTHTQKTVTYMLFLFIDKIMGILDEITPNWKLCSQAQNKSTEGLEFKFLTALYN